MHVRLLPLGPSGVHPHGLAAARFSSWNPNTGIPTGNGALPVVFYASVPFADTGRNGITAADTASGPPDSHLPPAGSTRPEGSASIHRVISLAEVGRSCQSALNSTVQKPIGLQRWEAIP
ncbi:MAG TPA: hypothetical protein VFB82_20470, partial [Blastocatellia bacterium]|nr:hypothetical protein [Blastocatellia bacterium]